MIRVLYIIRHCAAVGQQPTDPLMREGYAQAQHVADVLVRVGITRIVASPWMRACQSIAPLAERLALPIETDERLIEPLLSTRTIVNWRDCLAATFEDDALQFAGGESSGGATQRVMAAINDIVRHEARITAVVTHGRLMTLLLRQFDARFGFDTWARLTYPDVYCVVITNRSVHVEHVWTEAPELIDQMALPLYV